MGNGNNMLCWDEMWINKYESLWSLIEKIKFANVAQSNDILKLLGIDEIVRIKGHITSEKFRSLYTFRGFDRDKMFNYTGIDLNMHKKIVLKLMNTIDSRNKPSRCFRQFLRYCPECMKKCYHSYLHQYILLDICPFHQIPLIEECPNCGRQLLNHIVIEASPFQCRHCGYLYGNISERPFFKLWNSNPQINISYVERWL